MMKLILLLIALVAGMLAPLQAGQLIMALFMDHYGLLGVSVQHLNWQRLTGVILITAQVFLIRKA
ncbi:MAG: hypothetical protein GY710_26810 [Desulfobacteraceae bacterium]|nr:hypothetical protein [Desulfobacteraceae bacterium]